MSIRDIFLMALVVLAFMAAGIYLSDGSEAACVDVWSPANCR